MIIVLSQPIVNQTVQYLHQGEEEGGTGGIKYIASLLSAETRRYSFLPVFITNEILKMSIFYFSAVQHLRFNFNERKLCVICHTVVTVLHTTLSLKATLGIEKVGL